MKIALFTGTAYRHVYFANTIISAGNVVLHVRQQRSNLLTDEVSTEVYSAEDSQLLQMHGELRLAKEKEYFLPFGEKTMDVSKTIDITKEELNGTRVIEAIRESKPDVILVYGTHLLKPELLAELPKWTINLHGGLSPYYKGAATLYWPIYMMQPQHVGFTLHLIDDKIDHGAILHQNRPEIFANDTIHDLGCRTIVVAAKDAVSLVKKIEKGEIELYEQKSKGKLFYEADFKPYHLRVTNYLMEHGLLGEYVANKGIFPDPKLIQQV